MTTWTEGPGVWSAFRGAASSALRRSAVLLLALGLVATGILVRVAAALDGLFSGLSQLQRAPPPPLAVRQPFRSVLAGIAAGRRGLGAAGGAVARLTGRLRTLAVRGDSYLDRRREVVAAPMTV